jgi:hypothetical protein
MALNNYMQELQDLLSDDDQRRYQPADIKRYINRARRKIAGATQCIRILAPSTGSFATLTVAAGGTGYTAPPSVSINAPDGVGSPLTQATATATVAGGAVTGFIITNAGAGYVNPPIITITGTGTGAVAASTYTPFVAAKPAQEVYTFASVNPIIQANNPGVQSIISIQSLAVSWGSWKPVNRWMGSWAAFQAYCRMLNVGQENYPTVWSQYGQGENGSVYLFPIPSVLAQMDWDCYCQPIELATDEDAEAIPHPFTEPIPFYAAYLAYLRAQNMEMAEKMRQMFGQQMAEARSFASPAMVANFYETGL